MENSSLFADTDSLFGIPLPKSICGFSRTRIDDNESQSPGLGYTCAFHSPEGTAGIYIYDLGIEEIPEGPYSDTVMGHFKGCVKDVMDSKGNGLYSDVQMRGSYITGRERGRPEFATAGFIMKTTRENGSDVKPSILFLTGHKNKFVKIRISLSGDPEQVRTIPELFAAEYAALLWPEGATNIPQVPADIEIDA